VQAIVDWSCAILLANLTIICDEHPAVDEIAAELTKTVAQARRIITGEKPPRRIGVACHCGRTLKVTLDTAGVRCPDCSTQYGHSEALQLPLAERRAA
jgi:tRNA(Ile2) C34 agmatinyltransferase TiaS